MKTKLIADFAKGGMTNYEVFKIICAHNEGIDAYSLSDITGAIKSVKANYPDKLKHMRIIANQEQGVLEVYEDGDNLTYSVQENHHYTLAMIDDAKGINFEETKKNIQALYKKHIASEDALLLNPVFERNNTKQHG